MRQSTKISLVIATSLLAATTAIAAAHGKIVHARRTKQLLQAAKDMQSLPVLGGWITEIPDPFANNWHLNGGVIVQTTSGRRTRSFSVEASTGVITFD